VAPPDDAEGGKEEWVNVVGEGRGWVSVEGDGGNGGVGHWMGREERGLG